ncbi:butyrophilin subfamily 3 member A2-like [Dicentrarchus labrax]|uniref:butyrophilin subfamily 3 member A2-like n=1 Tax=Dicentrarchus labrax TaxID=13489 RepID=UPI0021F68C08|nr:butyrophilin subfamily 3 member A2-like [Dicentrarchus labrax]XP_051285345.1 butyrophilin subfamily 3 member A2-like [Dicentrarchus labrax]
MINIKDGLLRTVFLLTLFCGGQVQQIGPLQPVVVMVDDDIVLPCQLEPPVNAVSMTMEWGRPDLEPRFVYVWHDGQELLADQNQAYKGRASLSIDRLKLGDLSLNLYKVTISDNGRYRCFIPKLNKEYFVELLVGAVSSPGISLAGIHKANSAVMLDCRSKGWYPEPEVVWLDSEGNLLSAGPTETVRGPDDLYTVSSRVTVEKRHSNNFTCRVQQKDINQTRETHIYVPEDFFVAQSNCAASITFSVLFGFMFVLAVALFLWKRRQNEIERSREELLENLENMKSRLTAELESREEEQKCMAQVIETLKELNNGLKKQKEELMVQSQETGRLVGENESKVKSVEKEVTDKEGDKTANKAQGYLKIKEIITQTNWNLEERKREHQQLHINTERLMKSTMDEVKIITERKKEVEKQMKDIEKQREEIESKLQSKRGGRLL